MDLYIKPGPCGVGTHSATCLTRNSDRGHKKEYVPLKDRRDNPSAVEENAQPPPPLVAVMGPKGISKSVIMRIFLPLFHLQYPL